MHRLQDTFTSRISSGQWHLEHSCTSRSCIAAIFIAWLYTHTMVKLYWTSLRALDADSSYGKLARFMKLKDGKK